MLYFWTLANSMKYHDRFYIIRQDWQEPFERACMLERKLGSQIFQHLPSVQAYPSFDIALSILFNATTTGDAGRTFTTGWFSGWLHLCNLKTSNDNLALTRAGIVLFCNSEANTEQTDVCTCRRTTRAKLKLVEANLERQANFSLQERVMIFHCCAQRNHGIFLTSPLKSWK